MVGTIDTPGVVNKVGVQPATLEGVFDPAKLGQTQVTALADHFAAQFRTIDPQAVVGLVADIAVRFGTGLHVGANAAHPQQIHLGLQNMRNQHVRRHPVGLDTQQLFHFRADGDRLGAAIEHAAAFGNEFRVVIGPGRTGHFKQPLALFVAHLRVRVRIDEDVHVVECGHQLGLLGTQHAVAEHVPAHIADTDGGEFVLGRVDAHFPEMTLDRHPGATGGNAHLLVVVAVAASGSKGIAHPEAVFGGDLVGDVGEGGGALVGGHDQVMVVFIMPHHTFGRTDAGLDQVVGQIQQTTNEGLVGLNALGHEGFPVGRVRQAFGDESALGTDRHNDRVFDLLGFDQAQDLGAIVLEPVGPTQATPCDLAAPQVYPFDPR